MAHKERTQTQDCGKEKGRVEVPAFSSEVLGRIPNGLKIPFVLHAIGQEKQLKNGVQEERQKGISHV